MDELRTKIAEICFDEGNDEMYSCQRMADRILAIPEIAEALRLQPIKDLGMQRRN